MTLPAPIPAVVLAGGAARRMGGGDKGLLTLRGTPLLAHVLARIGAQCGALAINANGDPARFAAFGLPVLPDTVEGQAGPLAGVLAAMNWAARAGAGQVLTVAADTPFLPPDLLARLHAAGRGDIAVGASLGTDGALHRHPTAALWPVALRHDLARALGAGTRRMTDFTEAHDARTVVFEHRGTDPFLNINTPDDLAWAEGQVMRPRPFDRIAILDWSARGSPSPARESADAIWIGEAVVGGGGVKAGYHRTRHAAMKTLTALSEAAVATGGRLLIGADFAFGYPTGFAARVAGSAEALALWRHLRQAITDTETNASNHRAVAAALNRHYGDTGPFWGNHFKADVPGLTRDRPALPEGLPRHRLTEEAARAAGAQPKSVWQISYAGCVGAQALTGIPALADLRARLAPHVAVWPFEPHDEAEVVLAEVYPALIGPEVRDLSRASGDTIPDRVQVRLLAASLAHLARSGALDALFRPQAPRDVLREEGWILGVGFEPVLRTAAMAALRAEAGMGQSSPSASGAFKGA